MKKFLICCGLIVLIARIPSAFPWMEANVWYFDKYQHATAGVLLMIGFFDSWKKNAGVAFMWLLLFNVAWETFEVAVGLIPAGVSWMWDTIGDVIVTIGSGMHWFYLTDYLKKRKKAVNRPF